MTRSRGRPSTPTPIPNPRVFADRTITSGAHFDPALGEFVLRYDTVVAAPDPDALPLDFLDTAYAAAAETGGWDRAALECPLGVPGRVLPL